MTDVCSKSVVKHKEFSLLVTVNDDNKIYSDMVLCFSRPEESWAECWQLQYHTVSFASLCACRTGFGSKSGTCNYNKGLQVLLFWDPGIWWLEFGIIERKRTMFGCVYEWHTWQCGNFFGLRNWEGHCSKEAKAIRKVSCNILKIIPLNSK